MKPTTKSDFSQGSIAAHMLRIALPMTLAQLINVLYNIVDRIFIGRLPEDATNALTGIGVAFPICTMTIAFANLVGMGGAPLFSIERGRGNAEEARKLLGTSFKLLVLTGLVLSALILCVKKPLLYLLGASEATFGYADAYISVYALGTVFVMLSLGMNSFINAQGFSGIGMLTVTLGAVCNLILDPVFIFVLKLGVRGAAIATVISQGVAALWTLWFLLGKKATVRLSVKNCSMEWKRVKAIITLGTAGFIMSITNSAVQIVCNINLAVHGGDTYIAAMTIINSVREVVSMVVHGISNGAQPIMSFNYGAKQYGRVKATIRLMAALLLVYTTLAWVAVMLLSKQLVMLFNDDAELLPIAVESMHIYFFGFFMMAFQFVGQTTFQALGKSRQSIFFSLFRKVIIVIPLTYALPYLAGLGVDGVFMAEPISNLVGGLACFATMYWTVYRKLA